MTQDTHTNAINSILEFRGHRIGFPDGRYFGECTAIVAHLHERLGIPLPSMYGNRADGWGVAFPQLLAAYYTHEAYQPGKAYPYGTWLLWNSPHIALVLSHDGGNTVQVFQQNADPNGAACEVFNRVINNQWHSCNYALIPRIDEPQPAPAIPTPATYQVVETYPGGKQIRLNKQPTNLWGMNYHFDYMKNHPVEVHDNGEIWAVTNKVHHEDGYDYYRRDGQVDGFNVLDCDDYTPPPPPAPPAAPVEVKRAEKYTLVTTVMYFSSASDASMHNDAKGTLKPGDYFVFGTNGKAYNLSTDNMKDQQTWVNSNDNVIEVVQPTPIAIQPATPVQDVQPATPIPVVPNKENDMATDWKQSTPLKVNPHTGQWLPVKYRSTNDMVVHIRSLDGKQPATLPLPPHHELMIVSTFRGPDGETYARDDLLTASHRYYALRFDMLEKVVPPPIVRNLDVNHDGDVNISDFIDFGNKYFKPGIEVVTRTARVITGPKARKFVDGFSKAIKKDKVQ